MTTQDLEQDRLACVRSLGVTSQDASLSALAGLAAQTCGTELAFVSLVEADRVLLISSTGDSDEDLDRAGSCCTWVVDNQVALVVPDCQADPRFAGHPRVVDGPRIRAYAGVPLVGRAGLPLGTLCVVSAEPRDVTAAQIATLQTLAASVVSELELRRLDALTGRVVAPRDGEVAHALQLRRALDSGELAPWFRPVVDLATGQPVWLHAELCWERDQRAVLRAADFLPGIASSDLAHPLGRHLVHESLRALADLRARPDVPELLGVTVELSWLQLDKPGVADGILADLQAHRLGTCALAIAVPPVELMQYGGAAVRELLTLSEAGVRVTLSADSGFTCRVLPALGIPVAGLRLPREVTAALPDTAATAKVVAELAHEAGLGATVTAEGISTQAQRDLLVQLGCRRGQGDLFGASVPADGLPELLGVAPQRGTRGHHAALSFWETQDQLVTDLSDVLQPALESGQAVVVIATQPVREAVERELARRGLSPEGRDSYRTVDAAALLEEITVDGHLSPEAFRRTVGELLRTCAAEHGSVSVFGEMVHLLWSAGEVHAAIELEDLWNALLAELPVTLYASYSAASIRRFGTPQQVRRVSDQHAAPPPASRFGGGAEVRDVALAMAADGASTHSIAAALNTAGYVPPKGKLWHWRAVARLLAA